MANILTVTVSQVNRRISLMIAGDKSLSDIYVKGEISNFVNHYKSGHVYFTLKDEETSLKCVMFSNNASKLQFTPEDGMTVLVRAGLRVYEREGQYQLYVTEIEPAGQGAFYREFERLKKQLELEGLFAKKRPLPACPRQIALVTSKGGAALQDIISVIERRYPVVELLLIPVLVQGDDAPESIAAGIRRAAATDADLIIFGRGGGSAEDLRAFNSEVVARAVYDSPIPTISAVGHETDFTIGDFTADLRAPTPSAAAELAVPDINTIRLSLLEFREGLKSDADRRLKRLELLLDSKKNEIALKSPQFKIETASRDLAVLSERLEYRVRTVFERRVAEFLRLTDIINSLNPLRVMTRGYSIVYKGGRIIRSINELNAGDSISIKMQDGETEATIKT